MIYYVEDDDNIRELVIYTLCQVDMPARGFANAAALDTAMAAELPSLLLLDVMLPGEDGLSILRRLRSDPRTCALPVIMLTAKGAEYDKVQGLDLGADDYITKPFGMAELVARIRARLRRTAAPVQGEVLNLQGLSIDKRAHRVHVGAQEITLTHKEYEMLLLLMENRGAVFSREQLLDKVWDMSYAGGTRTVDVHIQTLRAKLGSAGSLIETVRGVGYRLGGLA